MKDTTIIYKGEVHKGPRLGLAKVFDRIGYDQLKANESPHLAWNYAEHLKKPESEL